MIKNKKEITEYSFIVPIFNQKIKILVGKNKAVKKWFTNNNIESQIIDNADGGLFGVDDTLYLWFEKNPEISIVVHETAHCVFAIINKYGLKLRDEEIFCYLQEFIINNILKCVKVISPIVMDPINQK